MVTQNEKIYEWLFLDWHTSVSLGEKYLIEYQTHYTNPKRIPIISNNYKKLRDKGYLNSKKIRTKPVKRGNSEYQKTILQYRANGKGFLDYCKKKFNWNPSSKTKEWIEIFLDCIRGSIKLDTGSSWFESFLKKNPKKSLFENLIIFLMEYLVENEVIHGIQNSEISKKEKEKFKHILFAEDLLTPEIASDLIKGCLNDYLLLFTKVYYHKLNSSEIELRHTICNGTIDETTQEGRARTKEMEKMFTQLNKQLLKLYNLISEEPYQLHIFL